MVGQLKKITPLNVCLLDSVCNLTTLLVHNHFSTYDYVKYSIRLNLSI